MLELVLEVVLVLVKVVLGLDVSVRLGRFLVMMGVMLPVLVRLVRLQI